MSGYPYKFERKFFLPTRAAQYVTKIPFELMPYSQFGAGLPNTRNLDPLSRVPLPFIFPTIVQNGNGTPSGQFAFYPLSGGGTGL